MEKKNGKFHSRLFSLVIGLIIGGAFFVSCKDDYLYADTEPDWLGASIYDYLEGEGDFTYYVRLIEDAGYKEVLAKTGSKTLFVADDAAFDKFFENNKWGVSSYEQLSFAQKNLLLRYGMLNNAYLIQTLSNYYNGELRKNQAIRHETSISPFDSISFEIGDQLPKTDSWEKYRSTGIQLLKDHTNWTVTHFLQKHMNVVGLTNKDFTFITGKERVAGDAHIQDKKILKRDIVCKNGYVNVLEDVLVPPSNIAQHLTEDSQSTIISKLIERFSAPYIFSEATAKYKELYPTFTDTLYVKKYFTAGLGGGMSVYPNGLSVADDERLVIDPGWNRYWRFTGEGGMQADMAAMLSPTDAAMTEYFNTGSGKILQQRYHSWDSVPNDIAALLINRHLRSSLLETLPSRFYKPYDSKNPTDTIRPPINDAENSPIYVEQSNIVYSYIGVNGVVFHTDKVFPPDDYVSVYGPVLFSEKATIFNWIIRKAGFRLFINSLASDYSFFVPTDDYLNGYIDPITIAKGKRGALRYWYNTKTKTVNATVYGYNLETNTIEDSISVIDDDAYLQDRLLDLLDNHIVVEGVEKGDGYYLTKGGNIIHVEGSGKDMIIKGGGDVERGGQVNVIDVYNQENGYTYFIDKPIQTPLKSVYQVLSETPQFSEFFDLINGFTSASTHSILVKKANRSGIDYNIKFLNTYNYTIYVPTNEAIQQAFADKLIRPWTSRDGIVGIDNLDPEEYAIEEIKLERFLRYHFQDQAVYINGGSIDRPLQSATLKENDLPSTFNTFKNKYYKLGVTVNDGNLSILTENNSTAHVLTNSGLYNILVRDYIFNKLPASFSDIDGSGGGASEFTSSRIETSSSAVIHQIDNVLTFD